MFYYCSWVSYLWDNLQDNFCLRGYSSKNEVLYFTQWQGLQIQNPSWEVTASSKLQMEENQDPQRSKASSSSPNELMAEWGSSPLNQKIRTLSTITLRRYLPAMQETLVRSLGGEDPLEEEWQVTPVCLPRTSQGQTAWRASLWGHKELDTTERLTHSSSLLLLLYHTAFLFFFQQKWSVCIKFLSPTVSLSV